MTLRLARQFQLQYRPMIWVSLTVVSWLILVVPRNIRTISPWLMFAQVTDAVPSCTDASTPTATILYVHPGRLSINH